MTSVPALSTCLIFRDPAVFGAVNFFLVTIMRYRRQPFSYSSLSSQFLENRRTILGLDGVSHRNCRSPDWGT